MLGAPPSGARSTPHYSLDNQAAGIRKGSTEELASTLEDARTRSGQGPNHSHKRPLRVRWASRDLVGKDPTFTVGPAGRDCGGDHSGPRAQRDLHGWP